MNAQETLTKARTRLVLDHIFFGKIAMGLPLKFNADIPTARTDGTCIEISPAFVEKIGFEETLFVIVHEVLHVALMHHIRRGARDTVLWNVAGDYVVNIIAKNSGFVLPDGVLYDLQYEECDTERVYDMLLQSGQQGLTGSGSGSDGTGDEFQSVGEVIDFPGDKTEKAMEEQNVKVSVAQAAAVAKAMGQLPGCVERLVKELLEPKVDWREVLRGALLKAARNDYTWRRPNRRFTSGGIIHPSLYSEEIGEIVVAVDTSGSMTDEDLCRAATEINKIVEDFPGATVRVLYCDAKIYGDATQVFEEGDVVELKSKGGGGTDFRPVFYHIAQFDEQPVCLLYITDLYGTFPDTPPAFDVIWGTTSKQSAAYVPFGTVVEMY